MGRLSATGRLETGLKVASTAGACDIVLPAWRSALARDALPFAGGHVTVCKGQLGDRAVALGAIATVLHATTRLAGAPRSPAAARP